MNEFIQRMEQQLDMLKKQIADAEQQIDILRGAGAAKSVLTQETNEMKNILEAVDKLEQSTNLKKNAVSCIKDSDYEKARSYLQESNKLTREYLDVLEEVAYKKDFNEIFM
jgi:biotin synthase-related radical SAM superfamily protein